MRDLPAGLAAFAPATVAALIIGVYLVLGEPAVGAVLHRRFDRAVDVEPGARPWLYGRLLVLEWGLAVLVLGVLLVAGGLTPAAFGIRLPVGTLGWVVTVVVVALAVALVVLTTRLARTLEADPGAAATQRLLGSPSVVAMLPRTARERRLFTTVAVSAGVVEELIYRGFGVALLAALLPSWSPVAWAVLSAIAFGLAHAYQGAGGVLATTLVGALLTAAYAATGSLLAPVVLHACVDLRAVPLGRLVARRSVR